MEWSNMLYFIAMSMLLTLVPGPDIVYVMTQSMTQGKRSGIATAVGLCTGLLVHTTAAALGVSAIFQQSVVAFRLLKYAGAAYLFYLAYKALREKGDSLTEEEHKHVGMASLYRQGICMNILNPKVGLFFLAFIPQFVNASAGSVTLQMVILGLLFIAQAMLIFAVVAVLANKLGRKLLDKPKIVQYVNRAKAGIFALIGIKLALAHQ